MTRHPKETHLTYLRHCISLAQQSPPKPTNFRVGCVIISGDTVLSTGYTLELPGNTHAEQCALSKLASDHALPEDDFSSLLTPDLNAILYTSLEPCSKRLSGNAPCVERIIATRKQNPEGGFRKVVFGAKEPGTFVKDSKSCQLLTEAGLEFEYIADFEDEILSVAMEGHKKPEDKKEEQQAEAKQEPQAPKETNTTTNNELETEMAGDLMPPAESQPKNPKKRMMEAPPGSEESWK